MLPNVWLSCFCIFDTILVVSHFILYYIYFVVITNMCIESKQIFSSKSRNVVLLQEFIDDGKGHVAGIRTVIVNWTKDETGRWKMEEVPDSEKVWLIVNGNEQWIYVQYDGEFLFEEIQNFTVDYIIGL